MSPMGITTHDTGTDQPEWQSRQAYFQQVLDDRQGKCQCLAGSCAGATNKIPSSHCGLKDMLLDGEEGGYVALLQCGNCLG